MSADIKATVKEAITDAMGSSLWQNAGGYLVYGGEQFTETDFEEAERFRRDNGIDRRW
jgi:hypothetical protein